MLRVLSMQRGRLIRAHTHFHNYWATCFMLGLCLAYSSNIKMEAACSSETSVDFQLSTWRYILEDILFKHFCENLKTYLGSTS
jgi:hypothetical protein